MAKICDLITTIFGGIVKCDAPKEECARLTKDIVAGHDFEPRASLLPNSRPNLNPSPTINALPEIGNGFGGDGALYADAALCLLKDTKTSPISSSLVLNSPLGALEVRQKVGLLEFDPQKKIWRGFQSSDFCVPVAGCLRGLNQELKIESVQESLSGRNFKTRDRKLFTGSALRVTADSSKRGIDISIPGIEIITPYGTITPTPKISIQRQLEPLFSPYQGTEWSLRPEPFPVRYKSVKRDDPPQDLNRVSSVGVRPEPSPFEGDQIPYLDRYGILATARLIADPGASYSWRSGFDFGSRAADPGARLWTAPKDKTQWLVRDDENRELVRDPAERSANASLGASINIKADIVGNIPEIIRNNPLFEIAADLFVEPGVEGKFANAFGVTADEGALTFAKESRPPFFRRRNLSIRASSSLFSRVYLNAGFNLELAFMLPLLVTTKRITILDLHPRITVAESKNSKSQVAPQRASARTDSDRILPTLPNQPAPSSFSSFQTLGGAQVQGEDMIRSCLAQPRSTGDLPNSEASYEKRGSVQDLVENVEYPCDICVGNPRVTYFDNSGNLVTIAQHLSTATPSGKNNLPSSVKWSCDSARKIGCHNYCKFDAKTGSLEVVRAAKSLTSEDPRFSFDVCYESPGGVGYVGLDQTCSKQKPYRCPSGACAVNSKDCENEIPTRPPGIPGTPAPSQPQSGKTWRAAVFAGQIWPSTSQERSLQFGEVVQGPQPENNITRTGYGLELEGKFGFLHASLSHFSAPVSRDFNETSASLVFWGVPELRVLRRETEPLVVESQAALFGWSWNSLLPGLNARAALGPVRGRYLSRFVNPQRSLDWYGGMLALDASYTLGHWRTDAELARVWPGQSDPSQSYSVPEILQARLGTYVGLVPLPGGGRLGPKLLINNDSLNPYRQFWSFAGLQAEW